MSEKFMRNSGYAGTPKDWVNLIICWKKNSVDFKTFWDLQDSIHHEKLDVKKEQSLFNEKFGLKMPPSLVDYLLACADLDGNRGGIFDVRDMDFLARLEPRYVKESLEHGKGYHIADKDYDKYGIDQARRLLPKYMPRAIVIGRYGSSQNDTLYLISDRISEDHEMEACLDYTTDQFRATNFGELMRNLSAMETSNVDEVPPYSQDRLNTSCAKLLPMKAYWK